MRVSKKGKREIARDRSKGGSHTAKNQKKTRTVGGHRIGYIWRTRLATLHCGHVNSVEFQWTR